MYAVAAGAWEHMWERGGHVAGIVCAPGCVVPGSVGYAACMLVALACTRVAYILEELQAALAVEVV